MHYESTGIVIINSRQTASLLSFAKELNVKENVCFFESVNFSYITGSFPNRYYGIYNGMCADEQQPFSTRTTFLKVDEKISKDIALSIKTENFNENNKELDFLFPMYTESKLFFKDILKTIDDATISEGYGGLRHYRNF